jgi:putative addiction module killer protein
MIRVREFVDADGRSPYATWFESLDGAAGAKVAMAIFRLASGNFSNVKGVGSGVFERTVHFGQGYRIYFGKGGERVVILLGGSTKRQQNEAISLAKARWGEHRARKRR